MSTQALLNICFKTLKHLVALLYFIKAHQRHVAFGNMRFLYHMLDHSILIHLGHTKIPWIIHFFNSQHRVGAVDHLVYIVLTDRITENHEYLFTIHYTAGKSNGMTNALAIGLMNKMSRKLRIFFADI